MKRSAQPSITMFNLTITIDQQRSKIREKSGLTFFRSLNKHFMIYSIAGSTRVSSNWLFPERFPFTVSLAGVRRTSTSFRSFMHAIRKPVSKCRIPCYKGRTEFDRNNGTETNYKDKDQILMNIRTWKQHVLQFSGTAFVSVHNASRVFLNHTFWCCKSCSNFYWNEAKNGSSTYYVD